MAFCGVAGVAVAALIKRVYNSPLRVQKRLLNRCVNMLERDSEYEAERDTLLPAYRAEIKNLASGKASSGDDAGEIKPVSVPETSADMAASAPEPPAPYDAASSPPTTPDAGSSPEDVVTASAPEPPAPYDAASSPPTTPDAGPSPEDVVTASAPEPPAPYDAASSPRPRLMQAHLLRMW